MKTLIVFSSITLSTIFHATAQTDFEPSVVMLYPYEIIANDTIDREHDVYVKEMEITEQLRKSFIQEGLAKNWKIVREKELEFIKKQDFATILTLTLSRELTYKEVEHHHENLLIFPVKDPVNNRSLYKSIATKYNVDWVINILKVELFAVGKVKKMKLYVQMYNAIGDRVLLDTSYLVDNTVTPESCEEDGWLCLVENIKTPVANALEEKIEKNRHNFR